MTMTSTTLRPGLSAGLHRELHRSKPDYVVYCPSAEDVPYSAANEHVLVFDGLDGTLMAVWTQSTHEGAGDHHIMFSRSTSEGRAWEPARRIVGPAAPGDGLPASWAFPLIGRSGRIYMVYHQHQGIEDAHAEPFACWAGTMACIYSDDHGETWSGSQHISLPRTHYDSPDSSMPPNWIVWQTPIRDLSGRWFTGLTRWVSSVVRTPPHIDSWTAWESVVQFIRFENVDDDPEPRDLRITYSQWSEDALRVPHYSNPKLSIAQEPSIVRLPDRRLFCVKRTMTGYIWYSVSADDGASWRTPEVLCRCEGGDPIPQPLCCCPIYTLSDGRYVLIHHNNTGRVGGSSPEQTMLNRRPAYIAVGEFRAEAQQPIWFSHSRVFMDNGGVRLGRLRRLDIGVYSSFTCRHGTDVLWHSDRKCFVVGKRITSQILEGLRPFS